MGQDFCLPQCQWVRSDAEVNRVVWLRLFNDFALPYFVWKALILDCTDAAAVREMKAWYEKEDTFCGNYLIDRNEEFGGIVQNAGAQSEKKVHWFKDVESSATEGDRVLLVRAWWEQPTMNSLGQGRTKQPLM